MITQNGVLFPDCSVEDVGKLRSLHAATRDGDLRLLSSLMSAAEPAKMVEEDAVYGWTPVHWASFFGRLDCLHTLIMESEKRATRSVDIPSSRFEQTPAHFAAFKGQAHCLQWLLEKGADCNKQDHLGETPLHKAARSGNLESLQSLIAHGSSINICSNDGLTPRQLAAIYGHSRAYEYLTQVEIPMFANGMCGAHDKSEVSIFQNGAHIEAGLNGGFLPENGIASAVYKEHYNGTGHNGAAYSLQYLGVMNGKGLNGFHKVNGAIGNGQHSRPGEGFESCMETDGFDEGQHFNNGHFRRNWNSLSQLGAIQTGDICRNRAVNGCKRSLEEVFHDVKRRRTISSEDEMLMPCSTAWSADRPLQILPYTTSVMEHQASMEMETTYSLYAYNTLLIDIHGS